VLLVAAGCATYTPIRTHFNKGVRFYQEKNYPGAAREYRLAIEEDPMDHRAHFNLAVTLEEMGRTDLARAEYEWILGIRPDDLRASVNLAALEIEAGEREAGYARLESMVARYGTLAMPRVALATHYVRDGRLDEAETLAREAVARDESDVEGNFLLGEILARKAAGLPDGSREREAAVGAARTALETALRNAPNDVATLLALGRLERLAGKADLSRNYYRRVILLRRRSEEGHRALADLNEEAGDYEAAVAHLWELRALGDAGDPEVSQRLLRLYGELLRQEEARTAASRPESGPQ
jgi:tetratricopeptide (TPR) repeat protein